MISAADLSLLWRTKAAGLLLLARSRCGLAGGLAEDCVQQAFIRLASQEPEPNDCLAWLVRVVRNIAVDTGRSERRRSLREAAVVNFRAEWFTNIESLTEQPSTEDVTRALQQLDDDVREIVIAHIWNAMSFRQIADAFELSPATAHRRYEAGIASLRASLTQLETQHSQRESSP